MTDGEIIGQDEIDIGVEVTDTNGATHQIEMNKESGEIYSHTQSEYPHDASNRTPLEDESVSQARKFARYYVYKSTEYETLDGHWNPDRVAATLMALWQLDSDSVDDTFATFQQQCRSHHESVARPLALPRAVDDDQTVIYEQEVYLEEDLDEIRGAVDVFNERVAEASVDVLTSLSSESLLDQTLGALFDAVEARATEADFDFPSYEVAELSELGAMYYSPDGSVNRIGGGGRSVDREPDARIELPQLTPATLESFKPMLLRHLVCQVRDFYIVMGEEPPPAFRVLGPGKHAPTQGYRSNDVYPEYFDFDADIPGYRS